MLIEGLKVDTFKIESEYINVEMIMEEIRENIKRRKKEGVYAKSEPEIMNKAFSAFSSSICSDLSENVEFTNDYDLRNDTYSISSHRPVMGKFLVKGRQMVNGEVQRYVDPIFLRQTQINKSTLCFLNDINAKRSKLESSIDRIDGSINRINSSLNTVDDSIDRINSSIDRIDNSIDFKISNNLNSLISSINSDIDNKAWLAKVLENRSSLELEKSEKHAHPQFQDTGINYFVFEDRFRGPREAVAQKQTAFLRYFEGCKNVLDIGCGRGEFLEIMRKNGIGARGIDLDETMVEYCRSKGLEVEHSDALDYIHQLEDASIDGIFIDQVVEHLEPGYLVKLLKLCFQKMKYGYHLIAETVNPLSFSSFANFYIDLTHIKPVHPETLKFLLEATGFRELEAVFLSPLEEAQLKKMMPIDGITDTKRQQIEIYNWNIDRLNATLYGPQDYALIGKK